MIAPLRAEGGDRWQMRRALASFETLFRALRSFCELHCLHDEKVSLIRLAP